MVTKRELNRLLKTFLFQNCDPHTTLDLLNASDLRVESFERDDIIYSATSFRREIGVLLSGRVIVSKPSGLIVSELQAGDLFGAAAIYDDQDQYVSTLTAKSAAKVLFLSKKTIEDLMDTNPTVRKNYLTYLTQRIRFLSSKVDALTRDPGAAKLHAYLLRHMDEEGNVVPQISMTQLVARLNMSRATFYRELTPLIKAKIVSKNGTKLCVLQPEKLQGQEGE